KRARLRFIGFAAADQPRKRTSPPSSSPAIWTGTGSRAVRLTRTESADCSLPAPSPPGTADWCDPLSALTGQDVAEENRTTFGLLLTRTESAVHGLAYGMGHLMINPARIDLGFGIEFAVRCLDEDRITKVRRQLMDARGRTDENSVTSGEHIRGFGVEQFG